GSSAIANAFDAKNEDIRPVSAKTLADSISVDMPSDGLRALRAATETNGAYIRVNDESILEGIASLGQSGIFAEPAAATALSGLVKARELGLIASSDPTLVMVTGSGLKDVQSASRAVSAAPIISPTIEALKEVL
ncbi:MAG: pyridoxal-phosphate dependent enzyme, partial [Chloroflexi bacterium]|nr:pyridoxal-phosphate dependent enzyme [Chloroflexota bacterium]